MENVANSTHCNENIVSRTERSAVIREFVRKMIEKCKKKFLATIHKKTQISAHSPCSYSCKQNQRVAQYPKNRPETQNTEEEASKIPVKLIHIVLTD